MAPDLTVQAPFFITRGKCPGTPLAGRTDPRLYVVCSKAQVPHLGRDLIAVGGWGGGMDRVIREHILDNAADGWDYRDDSEI